MCRHGCNAILWSFEPFLLRRALKLLAELPSTRDASDTVIITSQVKSSQHATSTTFHQKLARAVQCNCEIHILFISRNFQLGRSPLCDTLAASKTHTTCNTDVFHMAVPRTRLTCCVSCHPAVIKTEQNGTVLICFEHSSHANIYYVQQQNIKNNWVTCWNRSTYKSSSFCC